VPGSDIVFRRVFGLCAIDILQHFGRGFQAQLRSGNGIPRRAGIFDNELMYPLLIHPVPAEQAVGREVRADRTVYVTPLSVIRAHAVSATTSELLTVGCEYAIPMGMRGEPDVMFLDKLRYEDMKAINRQDFQLGTKLRNIMREATDYRLVACQRLFENAVCGAACKIDPLSGVIGV
jgi:hypothetical protein